MMAADYRHIGGVENRLGRHYSRFSPFWPAASFADQSLALRKSWNAGSNRRSQVRNAHMERRRHCRCRGGELRRTLALLRRARLRNREQWRDPCGALGTLAFGVGRRDAMGQAARRWHHRRCVNRWSAPMPQPNDLSRSLVALDQDSTIIAVVEMSQSSWLVAGMLPGIERQ